MSAGVALVGIDGRSAGMGRKNSKADWEIKAAIHRLYGERAEAGLGLPTKAQINEACGTASSRVHLIHAELRRHGQLPDLAASAKQRGGLAERRSPHMVRNLPAGCPGLRRPEPEVVSVWDVSVKAAKRRERERAAWGPGLIAAVSRT